MDSIPQILDQLKYVETNINVFFGNKLIQPTLNRMYRTRKQLLKRLLRRQIKEFDRGESIG